MDIAGEHEWLDAMARLLHRAHLWRPDQVAPTAVGVLADLGITATIYLVDFEQRAFRALPVPGRPTHEPVPVDDSLPGKAYSLVRSISATDGDAGRWWVPVVNGTNRMGVLEYVLPPGVDPHTPKLIQRCEMFAGLVGHLVSTTEVRGDHLCRMRRSQPMSAASEMLWQLLQPLTVSNDDLVISAILEPCYSFGGDAYDYALRSTSATVAIFDAVGKELKAGLATAVALSAIRAARRAGDGIEGQVRAADAALFEQFPDARFVTAFLAELHLETGRLRYLNAGHPAPLLLRGGASVAELTGGGRMPLGLMDDSFEVAEWQLERGDRLLLYTDGITEARDTSGEQFGRDHLARLAERHDAAGLPAPETVRRLSHAVIEHQHGPPEDDATLLLVDWSPAASERTVP